jgi:O-antigen/teichoic acid export membrane protein
MSTDVQTRRAARNFSALVAASILSKGLLFVWQIVLGNLFSPYEYGVYFTVLSLMSVTTVLISLGMGIIVIREVARQPQLAGRYWAIALTLQTALSGAAYALVVALALLGGYEPVIVALAAVASLSLIIDMFGNVSYDLLIAQERMTVTSLVEIAAILLRVGLAAGALAAGWGLLGVYGATLFSGVVRSAALVGFNWRGGLRPQFPVDRALARALIRDSLPLMVAALLALSYQHADKLMTTAIIGARATGYLAPAYIITFGVIEIISTTILLAVFPLLARSLDESRALFGMWVGRLSRFMLVIALPIALGLSIFAAPIIDLLFNEDYTPTVPLLQLLIWATLCMMIGNVFIRGLLIQNRQRTSTLIRAVCLGLNIALNAALLVRYRDPRGAALATLIAEVLSLTLLALAFRSEGFQWRAQLAAMSRVLLLGAASAGVMLLAGQMHWVAGLLAGGAAYVAGLVWGGVLSADDWGFVYRFVGALPLGTHIQSLWGRVARVPASVLD